MNDKSTCFISYCHQDINSDEIDFIVNTLKRNTKKTTEFYYDREVGLGQNFKTFMQLLDVVDLVVMICSPKYKERSELGKNKGGGVGVEYEMLNDRYNQIIKEKKRNTK